MLNIQTNKNAIPVKIGELDFEFNLTDNSIREFEAESEAAEKTLMKIVEDYQSNSISEAEVIEKLNAQLEKLFDLMLGDGTYKKIYEQTPSAMDNFEIFMELSEGLRNEQEKLYKQKERDRKKKVDEYKKRVNKK